MALNAAIRMCSRLLLGKTDDAIHILLNELLDVSWYVGMRMKLSKTRIVCFVPIYLRDEADQG